MACVATIMDYLSSQLLDGVTSGLSFLQNLARDRVWNLINLGKNAGMLTEEMRQLTDVRDDLVRQVELEEVRPRMKRSRLVAGWIERVEAFENEVGDFQASFEGRRTCLEGCSFESVYFNYELGQKAAGLLGQVTGLKSQRDGLGGELVLEEPPEAVVAVPTSSAKIVGGEKILSVIRGHLRDGGVGVIGIYGMGGVGKTTYLTEINNQFLETQSNDFEVVIWVTVTKEVDVVKIQEDVGVRVGFPRDGLPANETDRRNALRAALYKKRFLLLLDDVWKELDLEMIGIPRPLGDRTKAKVVFTTRSKEVCAKMEAHKTVKVSFLDEEASWELFCSKVGAEVDLNNRPSLRPLAKTVVGRCGGLPLALVTVGRAMAGALTVGEWEDAISMLRESPEEVQDMEEKVLSILKFSFDKLRDDSLRHCLLYCSLYPEDHEINTKELIEYWVGEGFLDTKRYRGLDRARLRGREAVRSLKAACLLESAGIRERVDYVKMHDVVRDMALWLTNGEGEDQTNIFMVDPGGEESTHVPSIDRWERAKRISFLRVFNKNVKLPYRVPTCTNLETLLIRNGNIRQLVVSDEFLFKFMPALRVLDLSFTKIEELPKEIGLLVELRYLNLQWTKLRSLPKELGNLVKLRQLNLRRVSTLRRIPGEAILGLSELQMLNLFGSNYDVTWESLTETAEDDDREITLKGMECALNRLEELGIDTMTSESLERLVTSDKLSKCTRFLRLCKMSDLKASHLSMALERLDGLRELTLLNCAEIEELKFSSGSQLQWLEFLLLDHLGQARILLPPCRLLQRLRELHIYESHGFEDLTWIQHLPCLETVDFYNCHGLKELIITERGEEGEAHSFGTEDSTFPELKEMHLSSLPRLKIISKHPLLLPSLEALYVSKCPELKKLPFGSCSARKLSIIKGSQEWWDGLEWDQDSRIRDIFFNCFRP